MIGVEYALKIRPQPGERPRSHEGKLGRRNELPVVDPSIWTSGGLNYDVRCITTTICRPEPELSG